MYCNSDQCDCRKNTRRQHVKHNYWTCSVRQKKNLENYIESRGYINNHKYVIFRIWRREHPYGRICGCVLTAALYSGNTDIVENVNVIRVNSFSYTFAEDYALAVITGGTKNGAAYTYTGYGTIFMDWHVSAPNYTLLVIKDVKQGDTITTQGSPAYIYTVWCCSLE